MKKSIQGFRILILFIILILAIIFSASVGSADLTIKDSLKILIGNTDGISNTYEVIVWKVRMPRIILAALVGAILALVGTVFQGVFRNSLADPHILGVSAGAALGATIAMLFGIDISIMGLGSIGIFAFAGAIITAILVYNVARIGGEISTTNMLLTGTAISTMLSAIISLLMTFNKDQISKIYMWTMGSFSSATWEKVLFLAVVGGVGSILLCLYVNKLNIMMLGEEEAKSLGVDTAKVRRNIIIIASLLVAAAVSVSGIIGFVGLIIPHTVRMFVGSDNKKVIPIAILLGSVFLLLCDTAARTIAAPTEIAVGIITSVFGAPYFIALVLAKRKG